MKTLFQPEHLTRWSLPRNYAGAHWEDYYRSGCGRSRDSKPWERANFDAMLAALGGEQTHPTLEDPSDPRSALSLVYVVRENHWAVGWVEWIAIHETAEAQLRIADEIAGRLENYPVISDDMLSQYEDEEAQDVWRDCYRPAERVEYIRKHRSQFEFRDFADMLVCCRGKYFAGYASELIQ